jgi:hypothetical protein
MDELNELKKKVSDFQMAQLIICNCIVEMLIENNVIPPEEAARKFRRAAEETGRSNVGLAGAEIVHSMVEFLEDKFPQAREGRKPS